MSIRLYKYICKFVKWPIRAYSNRKNGVSLKFSLVTLLRATMSYRLGIDKMIAEKHPPRDYIFPVGARTPPIYKIHPSLNFVGLNNIHDMQIRVMLISLFNVAQYCSINRQKINNFAQIDTFLHERRCAFRVVLTTDKIKGRACSPRIDWIILFAEAGLNQDSQATPNFQLRRTPREPAKLCVISFREICVGDRSNAAGAALYSHSYAIALQRAPRQKSQDKTKAFEFGDRSICENSHCASTAIPGDLNNRADEYH